MKSFPIIRYGPNPSGRLPAVLLPGRMHQPAPPSPDRLRGLGDLVAVVAEPVKRILVRWGPGWVRKALSDCGCDEKRDRLNRSFPFKPPQT